MSDAVICAYVRSPFTPAKKGALANIRPDDLLAQVIKGLLGRTRVNPADIEDVIVGCAFPEGEQGMNIARISGQLAGLPQSVPGATINRFCGSSMEAITIAAGKIASNAGDAFICAGVESMSRIPMGGRGFSGNPKLARTTAAYMPMGTTAEHLSRKYDVSRGDQEAFALQSHQKAAKADFSDVIIPITLDDGSTVGKDGCIRPNTSLKSMAKLPPAFHPKGTITAATSSPLTDGAVAVLVCSESYAKTHNLPVLARIRSSAVSGIAPEMMGMGPVEASRKALHRAEIDPKDVNKHVDIIEINEAFAAQTLAVMRELGLDPDKVNMDGGALALGHPLGASGGRIAGDAANKLDKHDKEVALATMCVGGGQGGALVLERKRAARKAAEEILNRGKKGKDRLTSEQIEAVMPPLVGGNER